MSELIDCPVPYKILYRPAGTVGGDRGGWGASLGFHVGVGVGGDADDLIDFLTFVGGTSETVVIGGVPTTRIVPLKHPYFPDMLAQSVRAEGTGRGIDAEPGWTDWKVTVEFALAPYDTSGDQPYLSIRRKYGASAITLPGRAYAVGGVPLTHDVAVLLPEVLYSFTRFNVPSMDDSVYKALVGKVNDDTFLGYDAETVRFDGVEDEITQTIAFTRNRTVTLSLAWRPRSWNEVMLPTGEWGRPENVDDGSPLYAAGDFDLLY